MKKLSPILFIIFCLIIGCNSSELPDKRKMGNTFEKKYGTINPNEVSKIAFVDKNDNNQTAQLIDIKDKNDIAIFINEINQSNHPKLIKGGKWSRFKIYLEDTIIELRIGDKSVGLPISSGTLYFFQKPKIITDLMEKYTLAYFEMESNRIIKRIDSINIYLNSKANIEINACFEGTQNQATLNFRVDNTFDLLWAGFLFCDLYEGTYKRNNDTLFLIYSTKKPERIGSKFIVNEKELIALDKKDNLTNLKFIKGKCLGLN